MKMLNVVNGPQNISRIILGCMRMPALSVEDAAKMISTAAAETQMPLKPTSPELP